MLWKHYQIPLNSRESGWSKCITDHCLLWCRSTTWTLNFPWEGTTDTCSFGLQTQIFIPPDIQQWPLLGRQLMSILSTPNFHLEDLTHDHRRTLGSFEPHKHKISSHKFPITSEQATNCWWTCHTILLATCSHSRCAWEEPHVGLCLACELMIMY